MSMDGTVVSNRRGPLLAAVSVTITVMAGVMYYAFKLAMDVRHADLDTVGKEALDRALQVLATELVFAIVAVLVSVGALFRREGGWGILALVIGIVGIGARFAYM